MAWSHITPESKIIVAQQKTGRCLLIPLHRDLLSALAGYDIEIKGKKFIHLLLVEAIAITPKLRSGLGDEHVRPATVGFLVVFLRRLEVPEVGVVLGRYTAHPATSIGTGKWVGYQQNRANDREGRISVWPCFYR